jgi:probable HAF family extracellular repeat protein
MQDLGDLGGTYATYANGINNSGQVVGSSYTSDGEQHAFLYDSSNGMQDLNDLIPADSGWTIDTATAINSDGKIAAHGYYGNYYGYWPPGWESVCPNPEVGSYFWAAFVLTPATTATYEVQYLGTLGGDYSWATGINDFGKVVGGSQASNCVGHAFLYDESATPKMQDLGGSYLSATGINDSGKVVGTSHYRPHAFLYDESATPKMQDLGTLGDDWDYSNAWGINDSAQVVGDSDRNDGSIGSRHAFLKESGQPMIDLNTLIPADSGWTIEEARAINSAGKIAATGYKAGVGTHALLLTPTTTVPTAPTTPSTPDLDGSSDTGASQTDNLTNDDTPIFTGTADADSTVKIYVDGEQKGSGLATGGNYSVTTSALAPGEHSITATASNDSGESEPSQALTITIDKAAPTVSKVSPLENANKVARGSNITATFSEEKIDTSTLTSGGTVKLEKVGAGKKGTVTYTPVQATLLPTELVTDPADSSKKLLKVTLDPNSNLESGAAYRATVTTGVKDQAGNALDQDPNTSGNQEKVWDFKAGSK